MTSKTFEEDGNDDEIVNDKKYRPEKSYLCVRYLSFFYYLYVHFTEIFSPFEKKIFHLVKNLKRGK